MNRRANNSFLSKPFVIVVLTLLPLIISSLLLYIGLRSTLNKRSRQHVEKIALKEKQKTISNIKTRVETAWSVVNFCYKSGLDRETCKAMLDTLRYDTTGYIWVHILEESKPDTARVIVHADKKLVGKTYSNFYDLQNVNSVYHKGGFHEIESPQVDDIQPTNIFAEFNRACLEKGSGMVNYYWPKVVDGTNTEAAYPKVSYVKYFPQWNWVIGAGEYEDHIQDVTNIELASESAIAAEFWKTINASFALIGFGVGGAAFIVSTFYSRQLTSQKESILKGKNKLAEQIQKVNKSRKDLEKTRDELERVNTQLKMSEAHYRSVYENVGIGIATISPDMEILSMNNQMKEWFPNIDLAKKSVCYKSFNDPPRDAICDPCPVSETLADGQTHTANINTPCGKRVNHFRIVSTAIKDEMGNIVGAIEMVDNITSQVKFEEILKESERRYRSLYESMIDAFAYFDDNFNFSQCNNTFTKMLGYTRDELIALDFEKITPAKWHHLDRMMLHRAKQRGYSPVYEKELIRKDGKIIPVELRFNLLRQEDSSPSGIWTIIRDISEKRRFEEKAKKSEETFKTLIANLPQRVLLKDKNSVFLFCNERYAKKLGKSPSEIVGKTDYDFYTPDMADKYVISDQKVIEEEKPIEELFKYSSSDKEIYTRVLKTPVRNHENEVEGILCVFEDFTERVKSEQKLLKTNKQLENTNKQLKEMQVQLIQSEKLASIGQLAAGVAHEINNPMGYVSSNFNSLKSYINKLTGIINLYEEYLCELRERKDLELVEKRCSDIKETREEMDIDFIFEDINELFEDSLEGMSRIIKIVQNLRDFSRIDQPDDWADFDMNDGVKSSLEVAKNEIKYTAEVDFQPCKISSTFCNSGQINQVFLNIIVNAAHAIKSQDRKEKGHIRIKTYEEKDKAVCEISDDGPGIAQEHLTKIFDPFFTTKPVGQGTGLGLNLAYDIVVNKHHGSLDVETEIGKGTKFTIKIPINPDLVSNKECENEQHDSLIC